MQGNELMTIEEAAEWLVISKQTLRRIIKNGEIPVVIVGKRNIRIKINDLEKYIESNYGNYQQL